MNVDGEEYYMADYDYVSSLCHLLPNKKDTVPKEKEKFFMDEEMCCNLEKQAMENNLQYAYKEYLYTKDRLTFEDCIKVKDVCHYSNG